MTPETWPADHFTKLVGIDHFELLDDGSVRVVIDTRDEHLNIGGIVHGGFLMTLLDGVMGPSVVRTLDEDQWCATETLTTEFLRPADGTLTARGWVERRGKLTAFVNGTVHDAQGRLVARATGVWAIRR